MRSEKLVSRVSRPAVALAVVLALSMAPLQARWEDRSGELKDSSIGWAAIIGVAAGVVAVTYLVKRRGGPEARLLIEGPDFGAAPVGETVESRVRMTNVAPGPIAVTHMAVGGRHFEVVWDGSPIRLDPGESAELPVTFTPTKNGRAKGSLRISAGGEDLKDKNFKVSLRANGV